MMQKPKATPEQNRAAVEAWLKRKKEEEAIRREQKLKEEEAERAKQKPVRLASNTEEEKKYGNRYESPDAENEAAFRQWLQQKISERLYKKEIQKEEEERLRREAELKPSKEDNEAAFQAWLGHKIERQKDEKQAANAQTEVSQKPSREELDSIFQAWKKAKDQEALEKREKPRPQEDILREKMEFKMACDQSFSAWFKKKEESEKEAKRRLTEFQELETLLKEAAADAAARGYAEWLARKQKQRGQEMKEEAQRIFVSRQIYARYTPPPGRGFHDYDIYNGLDHRADLRAQLRVHYEREANKLSRPKLRPNSSRAYTGPPHYVTARPETSLGFRGELDNNY
eukprot:Colp12_sorted_trinity150504_noHs@18190